VKQLDRRQRSTPARIGK